MKHFLTLILFGLISLSGKGQTSNYVSLTSDALSSDNHFYFDKGIRDSTMFDPKKATIYSAIVPGLGQLYNEKYWKVGLLYAGGFTMAYFFKLNSDSMNAYQDALDARLDTFASTIDSRYSWMTDSKVTQERNYYRRNRDMLILGFIGVYALQIIDANVDAHLREFELNEELSLKLDPDIQYSMASRSFQAGLSLQLRF